MEPKEFGEAIRRIRREKDLTQSTLGDKTGFSKSYLSIIENGRQGIPQPRTIKKLAEGLGTDYNNLMELAGYVDNEDLNILKDAEDLLKNIEWQKSDVEVVSEEHKRITNLMNLYFNSVVKWSEDVRFSPSDEIIIREHFGELLLKYKELIEGLADSVNRWNANKESYESMFGNDLTPQEVKELFLKNELEKEVKDVEMWVSNFPNWIARNENK